MKNIFTTTVDVTLNTSTNKSIAGFILHNVNPEEFDFCRECKRKDILLCRLIWIRTSWEWLGCSVLVFFVCLLSMSEHIVSTNQLDMELAVSKVLKAKTTYKYKKISSRNAEHLFSHIIYGFLIYIIVKTFLPTVCKYC